MVCVPFPLSFFFPSSVCVFVSSAGRGGKEKRKRKKRKGSQKSSHSLAHKTQHLCFPLFSFFLLCVLKSCESNVVVVMGEHSNGGDMHLADVLARDDLVRVAAVHAVELAVRLSITPSNTQTVTQRKQ